MKKPIQIFDLREAIIPFTLLRITNFFHGMPEGETIEIIGNDEGVAGDLKQILSASACEWIPCEDPLPCDADFHLLVRKPFTR
jgi:TusA-related sulfurtransferase